MQIRIRDKRNKGWFFLDNEYLNGYAKIFGAVGTSIYVSLCRHADAEQKCFPSQELIAQELGIASRTVRKYIKMFEEWNLISVARDKAGYQKGLSNTYYLIDKSEWVKKLTEETVASVKQRNITTGTEEYNDTSQRNQLPTKDTNTKNTHKKNTNIANSSEFADKVNGLIKLFEPVNPNFTILFENTTQRNTLIWLMKKHGYQKVHDVIKALPEIIFRQYAPTITTPLQLKNKLGDLVAFVQKERSKTKSQVAPAFNEITKNN